MVRAMNKSGKATEALTEQSGKSWYAIGSTVYLVITHLLNAKDRFVWCIA